MCNLGAHGREDPENNRRVYEEGIPVLLGHGTLRPPQRCNTRSGPLIRLPWPAGGNIRRFVYLSSSGVSQPVPADQPWLNKVYKYKRRGEAALRKSGAPYSIVRTNATLRKDKFEGSQLPGAERITVSPDDELDLNEPTFMYVGNLATVLVGAAFDASAEGKSFGVTTQLQGAPKHGFDGWKEDLTVPPPAHSGPETECDCQSNLDRSRC
jgi:hypothetical protein